MPANEEESLWYRLSKAGDLPQRWLNGPKQRLNLQALRRGSGLGDHLARLCGRSVIIKTEEQFTAALAAIELDGIVRRMVLCPPDLRDKDLPYVMATASSDVIVGDRPAGIAGSGVETVEYDCECTRSAPDRCAKRATEWVLLTSGTTGLPKLVVHTFSTLTGAISSSGAGGPNPVWATFYDIRRYGGLQIFLRAMLGPGSMVLSGRSEPMPGFLRRAGSHGVSHISGTPSHWRGALMSGSAGKISPRYVRLSGEIADQAILDALSATYPAADVAHAFASTEAGVAFDVRDGLAGFPESLVQDGRPDVAIRVVDGSLRIRSNRNAIGYLGDATEPLVGPDGFVDTGDMVERRGGRYYFAGRRTGVINVGGLKVHPEEVEAVINRHPNVRMSLVKARPNPITGAVVAADIVMRSGCGATPPLDVEDLKQEILSACRSELPPYKVPATIRFVPSLELSAAGKLARPHA